MSTPTNGDMVHGINEEEAQDGSTPRLWLVDVVGALFLLPVWRGLGCCLFLWHLHVHKDQVAGPQCCDRPCGLGCGSGCGP